MREKSRSLKQNSKGDIQFYQVMVVGSDTFFNDVRQYVPEVPLLSITHVSSKGILSEQAVLQIIIFEASPGVDEYIGSLKKDPNCQWYAVDRAENIERAIQWLKTGANDYYVIDDCKMNELTHSISKKYEEWLDATKQKTASNLPVDEIIGFSKQVGETRYLIEKATRLPQITVLLQGETGTGKGLIARHIHKHSECKGELVEINCAAIPEHLLESELFGYEQGAFTGARTRKRGLLELASEGTVMLDEISSMSLDLQAKIVKFIEEKRFRRVGGHQEIKVDVRVLACSNEDLEQLVTQGKFRRDLYYRLHVLSIQLSPLRDRVEDIRPLTDYFLRQFASHYRLPITGIAPDAMQLLESHSWPGNVRELKHVIERAVILREQGLLQCEELGFASTNPAKSKKISPFSRGTRLMTLAEAEREVIRLVLTETGGNRSHAAKILAIPRSRLHRKIELFNLGDIGKE